MEIIIGLIGAKGAGKTTAYEAICEVQKVEEFTLAEKLKNVCSQVFEVERKAFDSHKLKEKFFITPKLLSENLIRQIYSQYNIEPNYDSHIRPHIGTLLNTPRQVVQYVGTELLRAYDPDIHCKGVIRGAKQKVGVVTDIRFPNEYIYFFKNFQKFIPIYIKNSAAEIAASKDQHPSEIHTGSLAKKAMITVENDKDLQTFKNKVRIEFEKILRGDYV